MNIVTSIIQMLGSGNTVSSISSILGLNQDQTRRATSAAVPSLLAGLTGLASTPQGAEQLADTVSHQDSGILDNLTGAFSGQGPRLADQGSSLLGSLFGGSTNSMFSSVLSRFTGVGEGATGKLLGILTPIILGFLGKQQKSMGLNANGLASFLGGQKENINAAMPAGLGTMLSSLPGIGNFFGGGGQAASDARRAYETPKRPHLEEDTADWRSRGVYSEPAHSVGGAKKWVAPVLLALAALTAVLLWSNRDRSRQREVRPVGAPATSSERMTGGASSFVSETTRLVSQANSTLAGIKDPASAEAAAPRLQEINQQMTNLRSTWNQLPASARSTASSTLQPQIAKLKQTAQNILSQPGIGQTVRPQVEQLMANLNAFSTQ
jgi:hypothetical protein